MKSKPKPIVPAALTIFGAVFFLTYVAARGLHGGSTPRSATPPSPNDARNPDASNGQVPADPRPAHGTDEVQSYETLGRIISLPSKDGRIPLEIHHEEIPHFLGRDGSKVGMKEMIMPFHDLAPGVSLEGFKRGDGVRFTFEVRWNKSPRTLVTRLAPLEAGTTLKLSEIIEEN